MGRSGRRKRSTVIPIVLLVLLLAGGAVGAKFYADSKAEEQVDDRVDELEELFEGATPRDFLAFNSGRSVLGSVAQLSADSDDFVSVDARAERALVRFQPKGWWAGFTERCIVVLVAESGPQFLTPKTACVRVDPSDY